MCRHPRGGRWAEPGDPRLSFAGDKVVDARARLRRPGHDDSVVAIRATTLSSIHPMLGDEVPVDANADAGRVGDRNRAVGGKRKRRLGNAAG